MKTLTFDLSTHTRAYDCAALLRAQGFVARPTGEVVHVEVDPERTRWALALIHAIQPDAVPL